MPPAMHRAKVPLDRAAEMHRHGAHVEDLTVTEDRRESSVGEIAVRAWEPMDVELETAHVHAELVRERVHLVVIETRERGWIDLAVEGVVRRGNQAGAKRNALVEHRLQTQRAVHPALLVGSDTGLG